MVSWTGGKRKGLIYRSRGPAPCAATFSYLLPSSPAQLQRKVNMFAGHINSNSVSISVEPTTSISMISFAAAYRLQLLPLFNRFGFTAVTRMSLRLPGVVESLSTSTTALSDFTIADSADDEAIAEPETVTRHDMFYLEDVSIICGRSLFCVHTSTLPFRSLVLRRMSSPANLTTADSPSAPPLDRLAEADHPESLVCHPLQTLNHRVPIPEVGPTREPVGSRNRTVCRQCYWSQCPMTPSYRRR